VLSVRLPVVAVGFLEFSPLVWSFFELLRKDEDNVIQFSRAVNRRGRCVYDACDGDDEDVARESGCITFLTRENARGTSGLRLGMKSSTESTKSHVKPFRDGKSVRLGADLHPRPHRVIFPCRFLRRSRTRWSLQMRWR